MPKREWRDDARDSSIKTMNRSLLTKRKSLCYAMLLKATYLIPEAEGKGESQKMANTTYSKVVWAQPTNELRLKKASYALRTKNKFAKIHCAIFIKGLF